MRVQKISLLAVALVAGLSLTACQGDGDNSSDASDSASAASGGSQDSGDGAATGKDAVATGSDAKNGDSDTTPNSVTGACKTSQLAFTTSGGMGEGTLIVNLKNTGSATCALKGFPGADLKGKDGTTSAARSTLSAPLVKVKLGEETRFTLHYTPNNSGGSGTTFTTLTVTPPNETHSHSLPVEINIPVTDGSGSGITVDPVGTGK